MKNIKNIFWLLLAFGGIYTPNLTAQVLLLENFEALACQASPCAGTITPGCFTGAGGVSHGTPRISGPFNYCGAELGALWMGVLTGTFGEGVFFGNTFTVGSVYVITFQTEVLHGSTPPPPNEDFVLNIVAASGLTHGPNECEGFPPIVGGTEVISSPISYANLDIKGEECPTTSIIYCPTVNNTQLWIYPENIGNGSIGAVLLMDWITVERICLPSKTFDDPIADIPPGLHKYADFINTLTNTPNTGFVENDPDENTEFVAGDFILFEPDSKFRCNGNNEFHAHIAPCANCPNGGNFAGPNEGYTPEETNESVKNGNGALQQNWVTGNASQTLQRTVSKSIVLNDIKIFPNPATERLYIQTPEALESEISIRVYSIDGRNVYNHNQISPGSLKELDISDLGKGIYFLKITSGENSITKKLVIE